MSDAEVKIHVSADADLDGIKKTQQEIVKLNNAAKAYDAKGMPTAASSARSDARVLERDVARLTKERAMAEKSVTKEMEVQGALQKAGIGRHLITMRSLTSAGLGALAGDVFGAIVDQMAGNEMLSNRRTSTEAGNTRQATILNSIRGTSGQATSAAWSAEDDAAQLHRERPQLKSNTKFTTMSAIAQGTAWGGGMGAAVGSIIPGLGTLLGLGIGSVVGAGVKGIPAYLHGKRDETKSEQDEGQSEEKAKKLKPLAAQIFMNQEGGLERDQLQQRAKRTMEGQRNVFADQMAEQWLKTYRDVYNKTAGNAGIAKEMADNTVSNDLRDRQAQAGAGLVDARSGAGESAAAAKWGMNVSDIAAIVGPKIDTLNSHVESGNQAVRIINQTK